VGRHAAAKAVIGLVPAEVSCSSGETVRHSRRRRPAAGPAAIEAARGRRKTARVLGLTDDASGWSRDYSNRDAQEGRARWRCSTIVVLFLATVEAWIRFRES